MQYRITEFFVGLVFGLGLMLSGMTDPARLLTNMGIGVPGRVGARLIGAIAGVDPSRLAG